MTDSKPGQGVTQVSLINLKQPKQINSDRYCRFASNLQSHTGHLFLTIRYLLPQILKQGINCKRNLQANRCFVHKEMSVDISKTDGSEQHEINSHRHCSDQSIQQYSQSNPRNLPDSFSKGVFLCGKTILSMRQLQYSTDLRPKLPRVNAIFHPMEMRQWRENQQDVNRYVSQPRSPQSQQRHPHFL